MGDGGPLGFIARRERLDDEVLVVYGDIYNEVDYRRLLNLHRRSGCEATVVGGHAEDYSRFGALISRGGVLEGIIEKPSRQVSDLVNVGVYVFQ